MEILTNYCTIIKYKYIHSYSLVAFVIKKKLYFAKEVTSSLKAVALTLQLALLV